MKNILTILAATLVGVSAQAALLADIFVGGSTGGQLIYTKGVTKYTMNNSGIPAGFSLGYKANNGFFLGAKYTYIGGGYLDTQSPTAHPKLTTSHHIGGLELGYTGAKFKVFASYNPGDTMYVYRKASTQTNHPDVFYGSSVTAGLGFRFNPKWGIDLSYVTHTYTNFDFGASKYQTITASSTFNKVTDTNGVINLVYSMGGK